MAANFSLVGVVIAGGRSVRFGGEKAVAPYRGQPLLLWAVQRLQRACTAVVVNARPGTEAAFLAAAAGLPVLHDLPGDPDGPLSGVKVALAWAAARGGSSLAVSPCDAPLLPEDLYPRLVATAGVGAAYAETAEGRQPMCAVWPASALAALETALAGGTHPATWRMLEAVGAKRLRFDRPEDFVNVNTRAELEQLEAGAYQR